MYSKNQQFIGKNVEKIDSSERFLVLFCSTGIKGCF